MEDVKEALGGCPESNIQKGSSPIIVDGRESISISRCPICGGSLVFGSRDPCEGDYYYCSVCNDGPICFPLYEKPTPKIAPIIDAEEYARALVILRSIEEVPVPGYTAPSPHSYLDRVLSPEKLDKVKERVEVDQRIASGNLCDGCPDEPDCWIADEATAISRCGKLNAMRARAMR